MKRTYFNSSTIGIGFLKAVVLLFVLTSCNKDFPNILNKQGEQPSYNTGATKVLYVVVDGVRGKALQQLELPNLRIVSRNSLYTFGSLGDFTDKKFTKEMGLANLMTGVTNEKHAVEGSDLSVINSNDYPSILSRINATKSDFTSVAFTSNADVENALFADADAHSTLAGDEEVLEKTLTELESGQADLVVAHFSKPYQVGLENSFDASDAAYLGALTEFDETVGQLLESLEKRPNFRQEDWLVVLTSSIGGPAVNEELDNTSYGDNERNTITYLYSPKFSRGLLTRPNSTQIPYDGNAVRYTYGDNQVNATLKDASLYNFGNSTDDFTLNFFFKSNINSSHNYPIVLSKRDQGFGGNGWNLFLEVRDGDNKIGWNSNISNQLFGTKQINDLLWHSVTVSVHRSGNLDSVKLFMDGVLQAKDGANSNSLNNNAPLVIGKKAPDGNAEPDFLFANLQIYNKAMTNAQVAELSGLTEIDDTHPLKDNLIGYWPGYDDVGTNKITDLSGNNKHMSLTGNYNWISYSDIVSQFKPPIRESFYRLVPNAVDVPFFIYQWFGIVPTASWGLSGKSWTPNLIVAEQ